VGAGIFKVYQAAGYYHNSNNQKTSEDFRAKSTGTNTGKSSPAPTAAVRQVRLPK